MSKCHRLSKTHSDSFDPLRAWPELDEGTTGVGLTVIQQNFFMLGLSKHVPLCFNS
jgi:hypothetical protein